jgi:tetratricopeptide (TPR) repeat protein
VSPKYKPTVTTEDSTRHYAWKFTHLEPTKVDPKQQQKTEPEPFDIQLTTFRSWDEIGAWYSGLLNTQSAVTPAIVAKAAELTKGLNSPDEKIHALYNYVATQFRYISLSFGAGRYMPHKAGEVLDNQYGDCKDKHTLLTALLKASGIDASTVLIGAGLAFDPEVPSPIQFNHVITQLPGAEPVWLDTTSEFAPYGLLVRQIRDHDALVIATGGKTTVMKTPAQPPFSNLESVSVNSTLGADGVLTGHFDWTFRGDTELLMRSVFHEVAPVQWQDVLQKFSYGLAFAGDLSNTQVDYVNDTTKPLHISYDYTRKDYSDWANHRISPPLPPIGLPYAPKADKPIEPIDLPAAGAINFHSIVHLPKEYTLEAPKNVTLVTPFADYHATYSLKDGTLTTDRLLNTSKSRIPLSDWETYLKLASAVFDDHDNFIQLTALNAPADTGNAQAASLIDKARQELFTHDVLAARADLQQAEALSPKQPGLWAMYAFASMTENNPNRAIEAARKEIEYHPENDRMYLTVAEIQSHQNQNDDAIATLQALLKQVPHHYQGLVQLAGLYTKTAKYTEAESLLKPELDGYPADFELRSLYVSALVRLNRLEEARPIIQKIGETTKDPWPLNNIGYQIAESGADLGLAQKCAENSLALVQAPMSKVDLEHFDQADLNAVNALSAVWDTLGWIYYKQGAIAKAEPYIKASWELNQDSTVADHLAQIYQKNGDHAAALHMWTLGLAANPRDKDIPAHLKAAGGSTGPSTFQRSPGKYTPSAGEELGKIRTLPIANLDRDNGSAEFFLLFSGAKVVDAKLVGGEFDEKDATAALKSITYSSVPDNGPEKIIRRGILSCSKYTKPKCQIVLLEPQLTRK